MGIERHHFLSIENMRLKFVLTIKQFEGVNILICD